MASAANAGPDTGGTGRPATQRRPSLAGSAPSRLRPSRPRSSVLRLPGPASSIPRPSKPRACRPRPAWPRLSWLRLSWPGLSWPPNPLSPPRLAGPGRPVVPVLPRPAGCRCRRPGHRSRTRARRSTGPGGRHGCPGRWPARARARAARASPASGAGRCAGRAADPPAPATAGRCRRRGRQSNRATRSRQAASSPLMSSARPRSANLRPSPRCRPDCQWHCARE